MRDENRINYVLDLMRLYWKRHPDFRFIQMLFNVGAVSNRNDGYNLEDDELFKLFVQAVHDEDVETGKAVGQLDNLCAWGENHAKKNNINTSIKHAVKLTKKYRKKNKNAFKEAFGLAKIKIDAQQVKDEIRQEE